MRDCAPHEPQDRVRTEERDHQRPDRTRRDQVDAIAELLTALVQQHKSMRGGMMGDMMHHMMQMHGGMMMMPMKDMK